MQGFPLPPRDGVDFDHGAHREGGDLVADAGGFVGREVFGVDGVHGAEVSDVGEQDGGLDDIAIA